LVCVWFAPLFFSFRHYFSEPLHLLRPLQPTTKRLDFGPRLKFGL